MTILLKCEHNSDISDHGGYWEGEPPPQECNKLVVISSLKEGSEVLRGWVNEHSLGGGNMSRRCGEVREDSKIVARVSYNGRVWTPGPWEDAKEIET